MGKLTAESLPPFLHRRSIIFSWVKWKTENEILNGKLHVFQNIFGCDVKKWKSFKATLIGFNKALFTISIAWNIEQSLLKPIKVALKFSTFFNLASKYVLLLKNGKFFIK